MHGALEAWHAECSIPEYFGIQFTDYNVEVNDVEDAIEKEMRFLVQGSFLATEPCIGNKTKRQKNNQRIYFLTVKNTASALRTH